MFLWVGCKLPEAFEQEIRQHCLSLNREIGLNTVAFELPQHISLKISFQTEEPEAVADFLAGFLAKQQAFSVRISRAEQNGTILWIPAEENDTLRHLHTQLDALLEDRFAIPQHPFDTCFLFHSTLFMDPEEEKIRVMNSLLADYPLARELTVDTFLLGASETGKPGTCRIIREIKV